MSGPANLLSRLSGAPPDAFRRVWALALPLVVANLSVPLLGAVDTAVMGHLPDPKFLGAVAVGSLIFSFLYWGFGFLRMGTTGLVAQALGADDGPEIRAALGRAVLLALALGLAAWTLMTPVEAISFYLLDASQEVETEARRYFSIRIWGAPATLVNYVALGWFIGMGRTRDALALQIFMNGLNVVLDIWFVLGLGLGVAGVAGGTVISEIAAAVFATLLIVARLRNTPGEWDLALLTNGRKFWRLAAVNRDIFIRTLLLIFAFAWFTAMGARLGNEVLAANAVLLNFLAIMAFALDAFAHAAESFVGQAMGRRDRGRLSEGVRASFWLAGLSAVGFSVLYLAAGGLVIDLFTSIPEIRDQARDYLIWAALAPVLGVWCYQFDGIFIGATRTRDLRNTMVVSTGLYLAVSYAALLSFGNHGLWAALDLFLALRGLTLALRYPALLANLQLERTARG